MFRTSRNSSLSGLCSKMCQFFSSSSSAFPFPTSSHFSSSLLLLAKSESGRFELGKKRSSSTDKQNFGNDRAAATRIISALESCDQVYYDVTLQRIPGHSQNNNVAADLSQQATHALRTNTFSDQILHEKMAFENADLPYSNRITTKLSQASYPERFALDLRLIGACLRRS